MQIDIVFYYVIIMRISYPIAKSACSTSKTVKIEHIKTILPKKT